jgi:uncharacterized protein Usg
VSRKIYQGVSAKRNGAPGDHAATGYGGLNTMVSRDFILQVAGYGLTTAAIHYRLPDHPSLLQLYVWQAYDVAPDFPTLRNFLHYWESELDAALHSVRVSHRHLIKPTEWRKVDSIITIQ